MNGELTEGYYKVCHQHWQESSDEKTGWESFGWGEGDDFELVEHLEQDKFGNATKALFRFTGVTFLGKQHAAYNIQANWLHEFVEICKGHVGENLLELKETNPRVQKLLTAIDMIEESCEIKKYLGLK